MKDKIEIRWHGRGGQGAVTASKILAEAALLSGKFVQAFPEFGPERAGAPVKGFTRISTSPINTHTQINVPDVVIVLDPTLLRMVNVCDGLLKNGALIINTNKSPQEMRKELGVNIDKIATVAATDIAIREFKRNIPNTPMIAAFVKVTGILKLEEVIDGFKKQSTGKFSPEIIEANIRAMKAAYDEVKTE
jgi:pyruvate ferredoxin oxidoreductase gamma subunit